MASSRIGESLRSARARAGWSREELAARSGVSWAAIAQIESGRRRDVRLSSLAALADALAMSVDHLIGTGAATTPMRLDHRALPYGSDEEFLATAVPFLTQGIERSDNLLAVTTQRQAELLRDTLGDASEHVEFADSVDWYGSPRGASERCRVFVQTKFEEGAPWVRIVGEPVWSGRSAAEITTWTRYESLLNLTLASLPATIVCPYDTRSLPIELVAIAGMTHPQIARGADAIPSPSYQEALDFLLDTASEPGAPAALSDP
ncbi:MAG TPA: MEDS domain-containing protein [Candidatus Dormibacteraeota bacterium]|nr:MEDS domain-containing protein [Candidatus Dormibacteraeota bacterium]